MVFSWQVLGIEAVRLAVSTLVSLALGVFLFRKYIAPDVTAAITEAQSTIKKIASLGGIKKADYENLGELSKAVTSDLVKHKIPELELAKLMLSPGTWAQIEEALETNPAGVMELWDKYGHYFKEGADGQEQTEYMY